MCTKICDYKYTLEEASTILDEQFNHTNVLQLTIVYNHHQHITVTDILNNLDLKFWIIQKVSDDNKIVHATIVYESNKKINTLIDKMNEIMKENNKGKYKVFLFI